MRRTPEEIVERLQSLAAGGKTRDAHNLLLEAKAQFPNERCWKAWQEKLCPQISLDTIPSGARIYRKLSNETASHYKYLGTTPLKNYATYEGITTWKIEKDAFLPLEFVAAEVDISDSTIRLFEPEELPEDMLFIPSGPFRYWPQGWIVGIEGEGASAPEIGAFLVDKNVVTNREFKEFVDAGGYENAYHWQEPFLQGELELSWSAAITGFVDTTGKSGPATWAHGACPASMEDHPVSGVSWFEAMAYARFVGKSLPSLYQWIYYACPGRAESVIPSGNFSGQATTPRGEKKSMGLYGTFDTAGNVREWCTSPAAGSQNRFIQGGAWDDAPQSYTRALAIDPFNRSPKNGIRCVAPYIAPVTIRHVVDRSVRANMSADVARDYDGIFDYKKTSFGARIEDVDFHDPQFTCQKITTDAPWGGDPSCLYLFLPTDAPAPYQTVLYAPSFWAYSLDSFEESFGLLRCRFDFILASGRAVAVPVLPGMYGSKAPEIVIPEDAQQNVASLRRERDISLETFLHRIYHRRTTTISIVREVRRQMDFLESYDCVDNNKIAYYSVSLGAMLGPIIAAVETRIRVAMWAFGGLGDEDLLPETDPCVYLPRVTIPVLEINALYDIIFDEERSSKPWFDLLGTPSEHKKQVLYPSGHNGPDYDILNVELLAWLDKYLGAVSKRPNA